MIMQNSKTEKDSIVNLSLQEIEQTAGGPLPALWLIGAGISAVGIFVGGVNAGMSVGREIQGR